MKLAENTWFSTTFGKQIFQMVFYWEMVVVVGLSLKALGVPPVWIMMSWGDTEHPENLPDRFKLGLTNPGIKI